MVASDKNPNADFAQREAETRKNRPPTRTLQEAFSVFVDHPTPSLILGLLGTSAGARALSGKLRPTDAAIAAAVAAWWPFQEWWMHKDILHIEPREIAGFKIDPYFARRHRQHHENPSNFEDVFLPVGVVLGSFAFIAAASYAISKSRRTMWSTMASMSGAALVYEWIHYLTHTDYRPRSSWFRKVWTNHRMHHYRNEKHWYAFTNPWMDDWFRTGGSPKDVPLSASCRTLTPR